MNVISFFASYTKLPILIDDVCDQAREHGRIDEINFIAADISPGVLHGMHRKYRRDNHDGTTSVVVDIYYPKALETSLAQKRLVCCKEVLHVFDTDADTAATVERVSELIEFIVVPPLTGLPKAVRSDHNGLLHALMVLLPRDSLHILRPRFNEGRISVEDVAKLADVPEAYARLAISPVWEQIIERIE